MPDLTVHLNHGWRHLFTTLCKEAKINTRVYNAIMRHARRTVAESYGDVTLKAKATAIPKLPSFDTEKLRAIAFGWRETHNVASLLDPAGLSS